MLTAILRGPTRASFVHFKLLQLQKSIWSTAHLLCPQWERDLISSSSKQQHAPHQLGKEKCLSFQRDEHITGIVPVASKCRYCTHWRSCGCKISFKIERWTPLLCPSAQVEAMGGGSVPLYTELSACCSNAVVTFQATSGEVGLWAKPSAGLPASPKSVQGIEFSDLATCPIQGTLAKQGVLLSLVLDKEQQHSIPT